MFFFVILGTGRPMRNRTNFNAEQLNELETFFQNTSYVTHTARREIAERLNLNERTVKIWFQNRRMKEKRENIIASSVDASKNHQVSPSQSLESDFSSPTSHRSRSPEDCGINLNDKKILDELMQFLSFQFTAPEECGVISTQATSAEYLEGTTSEAVDKDFDFDFIRGLLFDNIQDPLDLPYDVSNSWPLCPQEMYK